VSPRLDWGALGKAGRGSDWDYSEGGDAERAVVEYLTFRSRIALALDMDHNKLEDVLLRLLGSGAVLAKNEGHGVLWRAAGLIEWDYKIGGNVGETALKHLVHEHPKWLYVREIAEAYGMDPTRLRTTLHTMRKRGASVQVKEDPYGQMWRAN
jgi:hypothetical protein